MNMEVKITDKTFSDDHMAEILERDGITIKTNDGGFTVVKSTPPAGGANNSNLNPKNPMTGDDWYNYFSEKYGKNNVLWKPTSYEDIIKNPQKLYGSTQSEIASILGEGWTVGTYGTNQNGWKFTNGDGMVFYHDGGGIHGGSYYGFSSGATGKVKIVGGDYIPLDGDKATIIYYN